MSLQSYKFIIPCFLGVILTLVVLTTPTSAQDAESPFAVRLIPQAEEAAAGSPFNYTVVVTNVSGAPVKQAIVFVELPAGTKFLDAPSIDANWDTSWPNRDEEGGRVLWYNPNGVVAPQAVFTFTLTVMVLDKMASQELVNQAYTFVGVENFEAVGRGPTSVVGVVTATPTLTPTKTPIRPSTFTPQPTNTATLSFQQKLLTPMSTRTMGTTTVAELPSETVAEATPQPTSGTITVAELPTETVAEATPQPTSGTSTGAGSCLTGLVIIGSVLATKKVKLRRL